MRIRVLVEKSISKKESRASPEEIRVYRILWPKNRVFMNLGKNYSLLVCKNRDLHVILATTEFRYLHGARTNKKI